MFFTPKKSPNFDERAGGQNPSMIILHYTGMKTGREALKRLCDPSAKVSAHYFIDEKGRVRQLVADDKRAWHSGVSYWNGVSDVNSASLGIEIVNPGHEFGYQAYTDRQIGALAFLCEELIAKYKIAPRYILGHSDVAPTRKVDPGHLLPWERLARKHIGLWPELGEIDEDEAAALADDPDAFHRALVQFGYGPDAPFIDTMVAFHRHFCPEKFKKWDDRPAKPNVLGAARLLALLRDMNLPAVSGA